jgi:hypothetical protein
VRSHSPAAVSIAVAWGSPIVGCRRACSKTVAFGADRSCELHPHASRFCLSHSRGCRYLRRDGDLCPPAAKEVFKVGTNPVKCTATDDAGNQAERSFNITVELLTYGPNGNPGPGQGEQANPRAR